VALLLVLVLGGVFAGAMRQLTGYIDHSGADLVVSQLGVTTMHMSASVLRPDIADRARETPGVAWAEPIRYTTGMVSSPGGRSVTYVIGYDPAARHGGPARLVAGRPPGPGEAVVDRQAADQFGVGVGEQVRVLGEPFTVTGLSTGGTNIANTTVFIPTSDFARLRGPTQSYVLVGAEPGVDLGVLRARLEAIPSGHSVLTREQFADSERRLVADMSADVLRIMSGIGFAIALAVIALVQPGGESPARRRRNPGTCRRDRNRNRDAITVASPPGSGPEISTHSNVAIRPPPPHLAVVLWAAFSWLGARPWSRNAGHGSSQPPPPWAPHTASVVVSPHGLHQMPCLLRCDGSSRGW